MDERICRECGATYTFSGYRRTVRLCTPCYNAYSLAAYYRRKAAGQLSTRPKPDPSSRIYVNDCACGVPFTARSKIRKRCDECQRIYKRTRLARSRPCEWCSEEFRPLYCNGDQRFCSRRCTNAAQRKSKEPTPLSHRIWVKDCDVCGKPFTARRWNQLRCSTTCARAAAITGLESERIMGLYRTAIASLNIKQAMMWRRALTDYLANRDGSRCAVCQQVIDTTLRSGPRGDPMGPSIDHVIPVSHGGSDDLANLRLTHWHCNNKRGNRGGGEQLRLVG